MKPRLPHVCSRLVRQRHRGAGVFVSWFVVLPMTRQNHDGTLPIPTLSCDLCAQTCSVAREEPERKSMIEVSCRSPLHRASPQNKTSDAMCSALLTLDQTKQSNTMLCRTFFFDHERFRNIFPRTSTMSACSTRHIIARRPRTRR